MLVTVQMAVYNCEAYVGQAVESVLAQQVAYLESKLEVGLVGCASR